MITTIAPPAQLTAKFRTLADRWKNETLFLSDPVSICTHPAYQAIIGIGPAAIPFILEDLAQSPRQWFWALRALTEEDPVPEASRGNVLEMAHAWIEWGRIHGWMT